MGLNWIARLFGIGGGRNAVVETVAGVSGVFRPHAENEARRVAEGRTATLQQFSNEFQGKGWFNQLVDGLNRLPRPVMAFGTIGLFVFAMMDPLTFAESMVGLDAMPRELWWLLSAIVSFYFGARELHKIRKARPISAVVRDIEVIRKLRGALSPQVANDDSADMALAVSGELAVADNAAIAEWKAGK